MNELTGCRGPVFLCVSLICAFCFSDSEYFFLDLEQKLRKYFGKRWNRGSSMVSFILFIFLYLS